MGEGKPPAGPATALLGLVDKAQKIADMPNLLLAEATRSLLQLLPKMPAARLFGDMVFQFGHSHPHPPTFGFPIPSTGPILCAGAVNVLINGLPAARNGDLGLAVWCGGYFPIFEVLFGSSHVFIGGSRAARSLIDPTLHCLPDPFNKGKAMKGMTKAVAKAAAKEAAKAAAKQLVQSAVTMGAMKGLQALAEAEQAEVKESEGESADQAAADAQSDAAKAAADALGLAMDAAQMAADAAAAAMGALLGKDPGVGFPMGMIIMGSPNVLIGGFPMPGWSTVLKGLGKLLKPLIRRLQLKMPKGRLRQSLCFLTGHPVEVASGRMFTKCTDFEIDGRIPIVFERIYDTSAIDYEGTIGIGWTHPYDQHIWDSKADNCLIWRDRENRQVRFDRLMVGQKIFQPLERVWLERTGESTFAMSDLKDGLTYRYGKLEGADDDFSSEHRALRLLEISDRNRNTVSLKYDGTYLTEISNGSGTNVSLRYQSYSGRTRLAEVRQHLRNGQNISLVKYDYDDDGDLIAAVDRTYVPFKYFYRAHLLVRETNRNGLSFHFEYDSEGRDARCTHTYGDGGIYERTIVYHPKARITRVTDSLGGETVYHYNDLDLVTKVFDAEGGITKFVYGQSGELLQETDEVGRVTSFTYDKELNLTSTERPLLNTVRTLHNEFGRPISVIDPAGGEWRSGYDENGNLVANVDPLGAERKYQYNEFGDLISAADAAGNETKFEWSDTGQIMSIVRPLGSRTVFSHNERNLLNEAFVESLAIRVNYSYDDVGRLTGVTETNSRRELISSRRFEYDNNGNLTRYTDALGNKTLFSYAGHDKLAARVDALGYVRRFNYDSEERLTRITNERGEHYLFEYDLEGNVLTETGFDGAVTRRTFNLAGELVTQKDALSRDTYYIRDEAGRTISRIRSDATRVDYGYDVCGRLTKASNASGDVRIQYDAAWRIVSESQDHNEIRYEYDADGRRTSRSVNGESRVEYEIDAEGNLSLVRMGTREIVQRHDESGRLVERLLPSGLREQFSYDVNGRLGSQTVIAGSTGRDLVRRGYEWNALGNLVSVTDSVRGQRSYAYDPVERLGKVERVISGEMLKPPGEPARGRTRSELPPEKRLWQADVPGTGGSTGPQHDVEIFQYDGDGNLLERNSNIRGSRKFSYGKGDRLLEREKTRYTYDAVGNLIEKRRPDGSSINYTYDADNQLIAVSSGIDGKVEFEYDAFGRRTAKISSKGQTGFLWDGDLLLGENKDSQLVTEYVHDGFVPIVKVSGIQIENYHTDYLGTPREVTNGLGEVVWQGQFDEYGRATEFVDKTDQPIRFQGQYEDDETGLFYNRFRYYDAEAGRYITQDPIGINGSENLYGYGVNPTNWIDPSGLSREKMLEDALSVLRDHDAQIREVFGSDVEPGIRGSLSTGTRYGASQKAGYPVPFDPNDFDVDAFVVDPGIGKKRINPTEKMYPGLTKLRKSIEAALRKLPGFKGMRNDGGLFNFAVWREKQTGSTMAKKEDC